MDSNPYAIELVTYLLVLVVYFYEFIVYMLLERNAFDSIAFFSQCIRQFGYFWDYPRMSLCQVSNTQKIRKNIRLR